MNENLYALFTTKFPAERGQTFIESDTKKVYSYADLEAATGRMARLLLDLGLQKGDRVAVQVEKSPEAIFLYLAVPARRRRLPAAQHRLSARRDRIFPG